MYHKIVACDIRPEAHIHPSLHLRRETKMEDCCLSKICDLSRKVSWWDFQSEREKIRVLGCSLTLHSSAGVGTRGGGGGGGSEDQEEGDKYRRNGNSAQE